MLEGINTPSACGGVVYSVARFALQSFITPQGAGNYTQSDLIEQFTVIDEGYDWFTALFD